MSTISFHHSLGWVWEALEREFEKLLHSDSGKPQKVPLPSSEPDKEASTPPSSNTRPE